MLWLPHLSSKWEKDENFDDMFKVKGVAFLLSPMGG